MCSLWISLFNLYSVVWDGTVTPKPLPILFHHLWRFRRREDKEDQADKELVSAGSSMPFLAQRVITRSNCQEKVPPLNFSEDTGCFLSLLTALKLQIQAKIPGVLSELSIAMGNVAFQSARDSTLTTAYSPAEALQLSWPRWLLVQNKHRPVARLCVRL